MKNAAIRNLPELRFQILLRIKHPTLATADITHAMQMEPEYAADVGETISATGKHCLHSESYWMASLKVTSAAESLQRILKAPAIPFSELPQRSKAELRGLMKASGVYDYHIVSCLKTLEAHREFFKRINDTDGTVTVVLQRMRRDAPLTVTAYLASNLTDLGINLEID